MIDMEKSHSAAYAAAGVDITAGYKGVKLMSADVKRTHIPGVVSDIGGFGGLFAPDLTGITEPVLVSGTDGVGTKLRLAELLNKHDTIGIDCVAMCVNDIAAQGAEPLFFLDYIACGKNDPALLEQVVAGVADGCVQAGSALVGGETAEMPGMYDEDEYDLAGFSVGVAEKSAIVDGSTIAEGDVLIGLPSTGVHSNGFSLVRKALFEQAGYTVDTELDELGGEKLGDVLLTPTKIYVKALSPLFKAGVVKGVAHITGGGFIENIPRMIPDGLAAEIELGTWPVLPIFDVLEKAGNIDHKEMYNIFNMGIGMVLANGSLSSQSGGEGEIRKNIIEDDLVDCIVAMPSQLFYTTQIPVSLWFLARNKKQKGKTLFIDADKAERERIMRHAVR